VFSTAAVSVRVITSPGLKLVVGLKTTAVVPPPEKAPAIIPVYLPVITMFAAVMLAVFVLSLKFKVIFASKAILFAAAVGVLESNVNCACKDRVQKKVRIRV